jgi:hypothetical protein
MYDLWKLSRDTYKSIKTARKKTRIFHISKPISCSYKLKWYFQHDGLSRGSLRHGFPIAGRPKGEQSGTF